MSQLSCFAEAPWHRGSDVAVVHGPVRWDYEELTSRASLLVEELRSRGLAAGQVVLVPEALAPDHLVMQHALARLGCGLLPVSARCSEEQAWSLATTAGVEWRWRTGKRRNALESTGLGATRPNRHRVPVALVVETSGSEGTPKAVMLTPGNILASARLVNVRLGLGQGDCWLSCLPRSHVGGLMIGYRCALAGANVLLHERFDASAVARDLVRHRVTHVSLVPPMLDRLLAEMQAPPRWLRVLLVGGQALGGALARRAIDAGWPLRVTYGMTETASQIATSHVLVSVPDTGFAGSVLSGIEVSCGGTPESPGRLRIRGPVVMAGYANPERLPGEGLQNGWLTTNDIGYLSDRGDLIVLGRADQLLMIGGEGVMPSRVEDRMTSAPGVESVVVVGLEDPVWGHRLVAAYTGDIGEHALEQWCRAHLPRPERPREYRRLTGLPLLASGKPNRRRILEMVAPSPLLDSQVTAKGGVQ